MNEADLQRSREVVGVFRRVTGIVWQRLSPTFGIRTVNAIARTVIARKAKDIPPIALLEVSEDGLVWDRLEQRLGEIPMDALQAMLEEFVDEFFEALASLIGKLVVGRIFQDTEKLAREEGDR